MSAVRYPVSAMQRARELREAGWTLREIARLLHREVGIKPSATTVALWCYDDERQHKRRRLLNADSARRRAANLKADSRRTPQWRLARMQELRDRGLTYVAIGQVAAVWWGEELSSHQVKYRLETGRIDVRPWNRSVANA